MHRRLGTEDHKAHLPTIEILDSGEAGAASPERLESSKKNSFVPVLLAALVAIGGAFLLINGASDQADEAVPATTTAPPDTTTSTLSAFEQRQAALTDLGVILGDGPDLEWLPVDTNSETPWHQWSDGAFVAVDGSTQTRISLTDGMLDLTERPSPLVDLAGYRPSFFGGSNVFVPAEEAVDHAIIVRKDGERFRVELPDADVADNSLIRTDRWIAGSIVSDRFVGVISTWVEVDPDALGERIGRDLSDVVFTDVGTDRLTFATSSGVLLDDVTFDEIGLSEAEIEQLRQTRYFENNEQLLSIALDTGDARPVELPEVGSITGPPIIEDGVLSVLWQDRSGSVWRASTIDGLEWANEETSLPPWVISAGDFVFDLTEAHMRRSRDDGTSWQRTRLPRRNADVVVAGTVIAQGSGWFSFWEGEVAVGTGNGAYQLFLIDDEDQFELREAAGAVVDSGYLQPSDSVRVDFSSDAVVFIDPITGAERLRVSFTDVAVAAAIADPTEELAFGDWPAGAEHPEWRVTTPTEVFGPEALRVRFIAGDDQLLAVVTTVRGYEFFITDTRSAP